MAAEGGRQHIRRGIVYSGRVQGVFFRATSADLARGFDVVGYVRNLPDGAVRLEAQGAPEQVDGLLDAIARHFRGNITRAQIDDVPMRGDESAFEIRY